jgi:hypothetical protein
MDQLWASSLLTVLVMKIDQLAGLERADVIERTAKRGAGVTLESVAEELISLDPVMRDIMKAARLTVTSEPYQAELTLGAPIGAPLLFVFSNLCV